MSDDYSDFHGRDTRRTCLSVKKLPVSRLDVKAMDAYLQAVFSVRPDRQSKI
ncbi:hypothetical protein [Rhizobium sp. WL3]|uniref:hypothetical protein n=1 Tax=Rhizobium sp. WL3 TaxID=2603277 RepID=UPI00165064AA|nr:hypothetical protein [Rhizobium sp. WL3]